MHRDLPSLIRWRICRDGSGAAGDSERPQGDRELREILRRALSDVREAVRIASRRPGLAAWRQPALVAPLPGWVSAGGE